MTRRKSFVIHIDSLDILDDLSDEQSGQLFKAIKSHQLNEELDLSPLVKIAFSPFKNQFARDDEKYQIIVERNKNNGLKGGRPKTQVNPKKPTGLIGNPDNPNEPDNDNDNDSGSGSKSESVNKEISDRFNEFWNLYGKKTGRPKCEAKFKKLKPEEIEKIFAVLPAYIASTPDKHFRKNPETWINNKCWEDEIITSNKAPAVHSFKDKDYNVKI